MSERLLEKLQKTKERFDNDEPPQCHCGSNIEGECEECNEVEDDHPTLEELRKLGDKQGVNPPQPEEEKEMKAEKVKRNDPSGTCPICKKEFKHLSRHRCKSEMANPNYVTPKQLEEEKLRKAVQTSEEIEKGVYAPDKVDAVIAVPVEKRELVKESVTQTVGSVSFKTEKEYKKVSTDSAYTLFLNAEVVKGDQEIIRFENIAQQLNEKICRAQNVEHWKCIEYGKSSGILSVACEKWIKDRCFDGVIVADLNMNEVKACLGVLKRHAKVIVQGV